MLNQFHEVILFGPEMAGKSVFEMSPTLKKLTKCWFYTHTNYMEVDL